MSLISRLSARLQNHPKRVVFPEGADPRIIQAARLFATRKLGVPILLGDRQRIKIAAARINVSLDGVRLLEPGRADELKTYAEKLSAIQRYGSTNLAGDPLKLAEDPNYFGCMMVASAAADAIVTGATTAAASGLRALLQTLPRQAGVKTVSSMLIMESTENTRLGAGGALFLADCAVVPEPTPEQLADIAVTTAGLAAHLTDELPRVAMLGYSSHSPNSRVASIQRVKSATELARRKAVELGIRAEIDGELQVDAALDAAVAEAKQVGGAVAGKANVLVFPDLNAGNIAAKLTQLVAQIPAYGQILTGLERPAADISRGASTQDILGAAVIVAAQAVDRRYLYPVVEKRA